VRDGVDPCPRCGSAIAFAALDDVAPRAAPATETTPPATAPVAPEPVTPSPAPAGVNILAIGSLFFGIVWLLGLGSLVAVILGFIARRQIERSEGRQSGRGLATAGVVLGMAGVVVLIAVVTIAVVGNESDKRPSVTKAFDSITTTTAAPFVAQDAQFSAVFPVQPNRQEQTVQQSGASIKVTLYIATTNDEVVGVGFAQTPLAPAPDIQRKGLDDAITGSANNVHGTVSSRTPTTYLGQQALDAVITFSGGVVHERVAFFGRNLYLFEGITPNAGAAHPHYDRLLETFHTL
jgi:hypothetical protein